MNYIELKKLINKEIRLIKEKIENQVDINEINKLTSKYQANNLHELIEILLCHTSKNCVNLNFKDFIEEINEQLYELSFENQLLRNQLECANFKKDMYEKTYIDFERVKKIEDMTVLVDILKKNKNYLENQQRIINLISQKIEDKNKKNDIKNDKKPLIKGLDL